MLVSEANRIVRCVSTNAVPMLAVVSGFTPGFSSTPSVTRHCHPVLRSQDRLEFFWGASIELLVISPVSVSRTLMLQYATGFGKKIH